MAWNEPLQGSDNSSQYGTNIYVAYEAAIGTQYDWDFLARQLKYESWQVQFSYN